MTVRSRLSSLREELEPSRSRRAGRVERIHSGLAVFRVDVPALAWWLNDHGHSYFFGQDAEIAQNSTDPQPRHDNTDRKRQDNKENLGNRTIRGDPPRRPPATPVDPLSPTATVSATAPPAKHYARLAPNRTRRVKTRPWPPHRSPGLPRRDSRAWIGPFTDGRLAGLLPTELTPV